MAVGLIDTGSFPKRYWPGVKAWYGYAYDEFPEEFSEIFDTMVSDKRWEDIVSQAGVPLPVVQGEGEPVQYFSPKQGFTSRYVNTVYGLGFIISKIAADDDQYSVDSLVESATKNCAFAMRQAKEIIGANILNNATSSSYTYGDGVALASASKPLFGTSGGTYSNIPTTAADLSEAALEQAFIDIAGFVDDANLKIAIRPKKLIIPRQLIFDARRLLLDDDRPATANRDINASKGMLDGYAVNHYLTSASTWFIRNDVPMGLIHMKREGFEMESDYDMDTSNTKWKFTERYAFGASDGRVLYTSAGP